MFLEMERFQKGEVHVAIVSNIASTGFNLHSTTENRDRRLHITMEVGWAPELLLQQLGRTHRSGQQQPPIYFILGSSIHGEQRYMSSMGRRLRHAGAVCQVHESEIEKKYIIHIYIYNDRKKIIWHVLGPLGSKST